MICEAKASLISEKGFKYQIEKTFLKNHFFDLLFSFTNSALQTRDIFVDSKLHRRNMVMSFSNLYSSVSKSTFFLLEVKVISTIVLHLDLKSNLGVNLTHQVLHI